MWKDIPPSSQERLLSSGPGLLNLCYLALDKSLHSVPQFPPLEDGHDNTPYLTGAWGG